MYKNLLTGVTISAMPLNKSNNQLTNGIYNDSNLKSLRLEHVELRK
jgi:hypothetical protein